MSGNGRRAGGQGIGGNPWAQVPVHPTSLPGPATLTQGIAGSHFFSGKPLPVAGLAVGPPGVCGCWRRAGSVLTGKTQVLLKSTSLGRPGSGPVAKLGSRRPLHKLSSDSVRCRPFCGDCGGDGVSRGVQVVGHSPLSEASSFPDRCAYGSPMLIYIPCKAPQGLDGQSPFCSE